MYPRYISIPPRDTEVKRSILVDPGLIFRVDNYVSDGPIEITISFTSASCPDPVLIESSKTMEPAVPDSPSRFVFPIPPSHEPRMFTVTWKNSHWISSRNIISCLESIDGTEGEHSTLYAEVIRSSSYPSNNSQSFMDTPHKMTEAPMYKVITVEGVIEGGHTPQRV